MYWSRRASCQCSRRVRGDPVGEGAPGVRVTTDGGTTTTTAVTVVRGTPVAGSGTAILCVALGYSPVSATLSDRCLPFLTRPQGPPPRPRPTPARWDRGLPVVSRDRRSRPVRVHRSCLDRGSLPDTTDCSAPHRRGLPTGQSGVAAVGGGRDLPRRARPPGGERHGRGGWGGCDDGPRGRPGVPEAGVQGSPRREGCLLGGCTTAPCRGDTAQGLVVLERDERSPSRPEGPRGPGTLTHGSPEFPELGLVPGCVDVNPTPEGSSRAVSVRRNK